jgi:hypothetical protein
MALSVASITASVQSHAQRLGLFEQVTLHEPKAKPQAGLTCAIWADQILPAASSSGLDATTALVVMSVRLYTPMLQEPYDAIDSAMLAAVDALMAAYSDAFTLEGQLRQVDLLGQFGTPLSAQAGYVNQDGRLFRIMTITLPLVVNDLWVQAP